MPPVKPASSPRTRHTSSCDPTRPVMESPSFRIQRWIGDQDPYYPPSPMSSAKNPHDSDEAHARRKHDHLAEVDWEREEFEREMALRFVMRDLQLGLEDRRGRLASVPSSRDAQRLRPSPPTPATAAAAAAATAASPKHLRHAHVPWTRVQPSTSTTTLSYPPNTLPPPVPPFSFPTTPRLTRVVSSPTPPTSPPLDTLAPSPPPPPPTPQSPSTSDPFARLLLRSSPPITRHRASPSLSSHFSCTSSASTSAETEPEAYPVVPNASTRSVVLQLGQKLKQGIIPPLPQPPTLSAHAQARQPTSPSHHRPLAAPPPPPPQKSSPTSVPAPPVPMLPPPYRRKSGGPPVIVEIPPFPGGTIKKRRVSVPVSLGPKKRRLVVRGIRMDDEFGVDGVRRWASVSFLVPALFWFWRLRGVLLCRV